MRSDRVLAVQKEFGVAAKGLEPCESGRQLEQQRDQLPGGEPQQQQPDEQEQQLGFPFRSAPSSTRLPEGSGADPAAILSPAAVLPGQRHEQKPPGASRLAEPAENSGRPFFRGGGVTQSPVRGGMFIATRGVGVATASLNPNSAVQKPRMADHTDGNGLRHGRKPLSRSPAR